MNYSDKWNKRFAFFDKFGAPGSPDYKAALKAETFGNRMLYHMNVIAVFFGVIYFFYLGLWKKNLSLLALSFFIGILLGVIELAMGYSLPKGGYNGLGIALALMWGITANYAYYLKEVKGLDSWNPFEGMSAF